MVVLLVALLIVYCCCLGAFLYSVATVSEGEEDDSGFHAKRRNND